MALSMKDLEDLVDAPFEKRLEVAKRVVLDILVSTYPTPQGTKTICKKAGNITSSSQFNLCGTTHTVRSLLCLLENAGYVDAATPEGREYSATQQGYCYARLADPTDL